MGNLQLNDVLSSMTARGVIDDTDVLTLRREVFKDGVVDRSEAEALFALDCSVAQKTSSWVEFFAEAITGFLVDVEAPRGYISEANAEWLVDAISADGVVDTQSELEVLLRCMEKATAMPSSLSAFALRQVEMVVVNGEGPLANGRNAAKGIVTADDVQMLRRVLYAYSGDGGLAISRDEAEVLFDINDRTVEAQNDPAWTDLFSKAIAFSLMACVGHTPIDRQEALRREEWLDDTDVSLTDFMSGVFAGGLRGYWDRLKSDTSTNGAYQARNETFSKLNVNAEKIDADEANWLIDRIGRDGILHENERVLIQFLKEESPNLHPVLRPLLNKVA